jgi:ABC-type multidrug transport system fused ATPase/permease subunit
VAVVGRTGAGKSTILSLAAGLYIPWSGSIRLAGTDPSRLDDHSRRALIGYVPQTVDLFSGTVTENITVGDPTISRAQVQRAAHIAGADTFITALPDGYDTELADTGRGRGCQLSAGQRQLLALARALVTAPAVLLLDEATSVVDGASDAAFRRALHERVLPGGTAVLTVAHGLATARQADHVLLIDDGRVVEQGAPGALLGTRSRFADLVALDDAGWDWRDDGVPEEQVADRPTSGGSGRSPCAAPGSCPRRSG